MKMLALIATAIVLTAAAPAPPNNSVRAAVAAVFAPYAVKTATTVPTERRIFSSRTQALIDRWQKRGGARDIITPLAGGDWLCRCQDWDPAVARVGAQKLTWLGPNRVVVRTKFMVFKGDSRLIRLVLQRERGNWLIDDIYFEGERGSLTTQLRAETTSTRR